MHPLVDASLGLAEPQYHTLVLARYAQIRIVRDVLAPQTHQLAHAQKTVECQKKSNGVVTFLVPTQLSGNGESEFPCEGRPRAARLAVVPALNSLPRTH